MQFNPKQFLFLFFIISLITSNLGYAVEVQNVEKKSNTTQSYYNALLKPTDTKAFAEALKFYSKQYENYISINNYTEAARTLELLASGQFYVGNYNESEQLLIKTLTLLENISPEKSLVQKKRIFSLLGVIYKYLKIYDKSLYYYNESLSLTNKVSDRLILYNNISNLYRERKEYSTAIDTLKSALILSKRSANLKLQGYILDNLGFSQLLASRDSILYNLKKSLSIRMQIHDSVGMFSNYRHLSLYYKSIEDFEESQHFADKALLISRTIKDRNYEFEALGLYAELNEDSKIRRFKFLTDSIAEAKQGEQNKYASLKYDVEKEKEQTQIAKLQSEKEEHEKQLFGFISILVATSAIAVFTVMVSQRKKKQLKTIYDTENRISKKLHDELANDTFQVMAKLQTHPQIPKDILDDLDIIYTKTRDISKDYNPLFNNDNFYEQLIEMLASYKTESFNVMIRNDINIDWDSFSTIKKKTIFIVLKELMTNNRKHSKSNFALIIFNKKGKKLSIIYKDDGVGGSFKRNNGLQNAESRIKALNGTLTFDTERTKGFQVNIQI